MRPIVPVLVSFLLVVGLPVQAKSLEEQRSLFQSVFKQIDARPELLKRHDEALLGYPLYPYLEAAVLGRPKAVYSAGTQDFIQRHEGAPFAEHLRQQWLLRLADQNDGRAFLKLYREGRDEGLRCHWMRFSMAQQDQRQTILEQFHHWWLSARPLPKECHAVEVAWRTGYWPRHGHGADDTWTRLDNAYRRKDKAMVTAIRKQMPAADKTLLDLWQKFDKEPDKAADLRQFKGDTRKEWVVRAYGIERLAWRDPEEAADAYQLLERDSRFADALRHRCYQTIALALAARGSPRAADFLDGMPAEWVDEQVRSWRIIDALRRGQYAEADRWMLLLPVEEAQTSRWRYLSGRSAHLQGNRDQADALWRPLRSEYNYYSFLARLHAGQLESMPTPTLEFSSAETGTVRMLPGVRRAAEWRALRDDQRARREWYATMRTLDEESVKAAVVIADEWDWKEVVIWSLGHLRMEGAWDYRFPLLYREPITQESDRRQIDPSWAFAITRQESAFAHKAKSSAGALGLMQLMPATAKQTAKRHKINYRNPRDLLTPSVNIRLGVAHLGELVRENDGNFVYATAAYNAGQGRVDRWRRQFDSLPIDLWIESIPYSETRNYVKNVMAYSLVYSRQLNQSSEVFDFLARRLQEERN